MNVAYKHLDSKLRIAELSIGQWIGVLLGVGCGLSWGVYLSPFGPTVTFTVGIYVAALPIGAVFLAAVTDFDPFLALRSAVSWRQREGRFVPGPGESARGYAIAPDPVTSSAKNTAASVAELDFASLWEAN